VSPTARLNAEVKRNLVPLREANPVSWIVRRSLSPYRLGYVLFIFLDHAVPNTIDYTAYTDMTIVECDGLQQGIRDTASCSKVHRLSRYLFPLALP
jgi:hypothetical protein